MRPQSIAMAMHSFLLKEAPAGMVSLPPEEARHALTVLRIRVGERVRLSDGQGGQWLAQVTYAGEGQVSCQLLDDLAACESPARITLYQGLPKADKLELVAQKAAELGIWRLCPVAMQRSVARWQPKEIERKTERLRRISQEALKQCGRSMALCIEPLMSWKQALEDMEARQLVLMPWEEAKDGRMLALHRAQPDARDIGILIGPEGGISQEEARQASAAGALPITLGPRILRCETATIVSCAMVQQLWGDMS